MKFKFKKTGQIIEANSKEQENNFLKDDRFEKFIEDVRLDNNVLLAENEKLKAENKKLKAELKKLKK